MGSLALKEHKMSKFFHNTISRLNNSQKNNCNQILCFILHKISLPQLDKLEKHIMQGHDIFNVKLTIANQHRTNFRISILFRFFWYFKREKRNTKIFVACRHSFVKLKEYLQFKLGEKEKIMLKKWSNSTT